MVNKTAHDAKKGETPETSKMRDIIRVMVKDFLEEEKIEEHEIGDLINRIKGINGVEVNEVRFRDAITSSGGSLQCVMDIIRNLMDDNVTEGEEIFIIKD